MSEPQSWADLNEPADSRERGNRVLVSVWISKEGCDNLDRIAEKTGKTRSDVLRLAMRLGIDKAGATLVEEARTRLAKK